MKQWIADYVRAQKVRTLIARDFAQAFERCDAVLTPATPGPAFTLGEKTADPVSMYLNDVFTVTANLAGLPAISVPTLAQIAAHPNRPQPDDGMAPFARARAGERRAFA